MEKRGKKRVLKTEKDERERKETTAGWNGKEEGRMEGGQCQSVVVECKYKRERERERRHGTFHTKPTTLNMKVNVKIIDMT